jgi:ATP-dependent Lhr-like helicase
MAAEASDLLHFATLSPAATTALACLSLAVRAWFEQRFGQPTAAQCHAWPTVAAGRHLLVCSPTGSGKTLAAFLPVLDHLLTEPADEGVRCLYVAPLKALVGDVRRNLRSYLAGLAAFVPGLASCLRVRARTGDTSARQRHHQLRQPPGILLTTPESLAVLLTQRTWIEHLASVRWLVVDEVHAFAGSKRGADLSLSLEWLQALARQPVQRIGLSATCAPLAAAASFLAGAGRPCTVARVGENGPPDLEVEPLPDGPGGFMTRLVDRLTPEIDRHRTVLVFTNARGLAERLTWALRHRFPELAEQITVHHSSLATLRRRRVERQLKHGRLRAVVSSTSLELGIDIGSVDQVVLIHPPGEVVRLLQRLGRSGHGPGGTRRGLVLTIDAGELLEAAVTCASSQPAQLETLRIPDHPLDVLCQHLLGLAAVEAWQPDEAFALVRRAYPYRALPREDFDACVAYLLGRHRDGRDWLPPRLRECGGCLELRDARTARLLRRNLGTILTDEARRVSLADGTVIGQVDEPFADRLEHGDRFLLDGRCLEFQGNIAGGLEVEEVPGRPRVPRWAGDGWPLSADLAHRLYVLRVQAAEALRDGPDALAALLGRDYRLSAGAAAVLVEYFVRQEQCSEIPDPQTCLVEVVPADGGAEYYLHTSLNRRGNDALARIAALRLARDLGRSVTSLVADLGFLLCVPGSSVPAETWRGLLSAGNFELDLQAALADGPAVRERFRRAALIGLMLLRQPLGRRRKVGGRDWAERCLFEQVRAADPDFVLLRQAYREVREDGCDAVAALAWAEHLPAMNLRCRILAKPSPFAEHWSQAMVGPFEGLESPDDALRRLHVALTGPGAS